MWRQVLKALPVQTLARVLEALWPFLLAAWFGAGRATDMYYGAQAASLLVVALAAGAFQDSAVVPRLARARAQGGSAEEASVMASLTTIAARLGAGIALLFLLLGGAYLRWAFDASMADALRFVMPFALCAPLMTFRSLWVASAQSRGALSVAPLATALSVALSTLFVLCTRTGMGVSSVPMALFLGEGASAALAGLFASRAGIALGRWGDASHPDARALVRLVGSEVLGGAVTRVNPVIDQACVRVLGVAGAVTHVKYASDIAGVPSSVVGSAILPVVFLSLSAAYARSDGAEFRRTTARAAWQLTGLLTVACALIYIARAPLIEMLFGHGKMLPSDVAAMSALLPWGLANAVPLGLMMLYVRANIALSQSGIMWRVGLLNAGLNVLFDVLLGKLWGVGGVVLGTAVTHAVIALVLYTHYRRARVLLHSPPASV